MAVDKGGRPQAVLTPDQVAQIEKLSGVLSKGQLADYFGVSENTFRAIEERQPEVFEAYKSGKAKCILGIGRNLIGQCEDGSVQAMIFYLKTQAGWKETVHNQNTNVDMTHEEWIKSLE